MKLLLLLMATGLLSACVTTGWNATNHHDEFTNTNICRIEPGTKSQRDFSRAFKGIYFTQHFYAENNNDEIRAGVRSEPPLPVGGDIQIKVGEKLYTLTAQDAPIDIAPQMPINTNAVAGYEDVMASVTENIQKMSSPYRAYTGKKAINLLRDIANTSGEVKFRTVGVNTQTSATGAFTADATFISALEKCGINL
jgi:hypothetical protein